MPPFFIFFRFLGWTDNNDPTQSRVTEPAAGRFQALAPRLYSAVHSTETFKFEAQLFSAVNTNKNNSPEWPK